MLEIIGPLYCYAGDGDFLEIFPKNIFGRHNILEEKNLDPDIRKRVQQADWPRITRELAIFACRRVEITFGKQVGAELALPNGYSVGSIVNEAVKRFLEEGIREWDPLRGELVPFLKGIVKSIVSHLKELKENELLDKRESLEDHFDIMAGNPGPEEVLADKVRRKLIMEAHERMLQKTNGDSDYESVALCLMHGIDKPADIAEEAGLDIKIVYYLNRCWKKDYEEILRDIIVSKKI